jgi:hypothetical protein
MINTTLHITPQPIDVELDNRPPKRYDFDRLMCITMSNRAAFRKGTPVEVAEFETITEEEVPLIG